MSVVALILIAQQENIDSPFKGRVRPKHLPFYPCCVSNREFALMSQLTKSRRFR